MLDSKRYVCLATVFTVWALVILSVTPAAAVVTPVACVNCQALNMNNVGVQASATATSNIQTTPADGGPGYAAVTLSTAPFPVQPGTYKAWCATAPGDSIPPAGTYFGTSSYYLPSPLWNEVNYVVNHKQGSVAEVQAVIWTLVGAISADALASSPAASALYADATSPSGQAFVPGPGQTIAVLFDARLAHTQTLIVEIPSPCGAIGDFVWQDLNHNGLQDQNELGAGLNGITVQLQDVAGHILATTQTGPAPANYTPMAQGSAGYYQFTNLCQATYKVFVDVQQPALGGFLPAQVQAGYPANVAADSNNNPATVYVMGANLVDETVDFGFVTQAPPLSLICFKATGVVGTYYSSALQVTGGVPGYTYKMTGGSLLSGLTFDAATGTISGTPLAAGTMSITAQVTDSSGAGAGVATAACTIVIYSQLAGQCAQGFAVSGQPYNSKVSVSGGSGDYTFTLIGSLPNGLQLDSHTGAITGTSTDVGPHSFSVKITDNSGEAALTVTMNCGITVYAQLSAQCAGGAGWVGQPYISSIAAQGGSGHYSFALAGGALPDGLSLNSTTGAITGTPTGANGINAFSFSVKVTDLDTGNTVATACTILIYARVAVTCPGTTGTVGAAYNSALVAAGGTGSYTFSIASGTLPQGLTLNTATGAIYGTPQAASNSTILFGVADSSGNAAGASSSSCTITVNAPLNLSAPFTTYTQGGWGATPHGGNPGAILAVNFGKVYPGGFVSIGGGYRLDFTGQAAIQNFLPQGGAPGVLKASAVNPASSAAGVFAGQVLALQLSVDFSNAGVFRSGLAGLHVVSGMLAGSTVQQVLAMANAVLGGDSGALPAGVSVSDLNNVVDAINNNYDGGISKGGYLK